MKWYFEERKVFKKFPNSSRERVQVCIFAVLAIGSIFAVPAIGSVFDDGGREGGWEGDRKQNS